MKRSLQLLCMAALAAGPATAGTVYLPIAVNEADGAYTRTVDLWATNTDGAIQGFVIRRIAAAADGTNRVDGDELGPFYLAPGQSFRFTEAVPTGFRGMVELDGSPSIQFSGALTTRTLQGVKVAEAEVPVLTSNNIYAANEVISLQGLERAGSTLTTNLGIVNLGHEAAACVVNLRQKDGLLIIQNVPLELAPLTQVQFEDTFAILSLGTVLEGARAEVSCNRPFWTYASTYNDLTGAVELIEGSSTVAKSSLIEPAPDVDPGPGPGPDPGPDPGPEPNPDADVVFTRAGEIIRYPGSQWSVHNYRVGMPFAGQRTFRKIVMDFDFKIGSWDPRNGNGFHCVFWLNNGNSWANMFGYVNTRGTQSRTVFQVNATGRGWQEQTSNGSPQPGGNYHMHYEYDLNEDVVFYEITTPNGQRVVGRQYDLNGTTFTTSNFFIEFGAQHAEEGPEAYTPNWTFSNLRAEFFE